MATKAKGIEINKGLAKMINDSESAFKEVNQKLLSTVENLMNGTFLISSKYGRDIYLHVAPISTDDVLSGILPYKYWITMWPKDPGFSESGLPLRSYNETTATVAEPYATGLAVWRYDFLKTFLLPTDDSVTTDKGVESVKHYMFDDELDRIIYMALTDPTTSELNIDGLAGPLLKFNIESAKDATVNIAGVAIGKGLFGMTPETPGLNRAMDLLVKRVKFIVDTTMKIDRYRRNTLALLAKTRGGKFDSESVTLATYWSNTLGGIPVSKKDKTDTDTEYPMYIFNMKRVFRLRSTGLPIEIDVPEDDVLLTEFDTTHGVVDSLGKTVKLTIGMTYMEFLNERFKRTINSETLQNVIADAQQSATDGLLGILQNAGILSMVDKYIGSAISAGVDAVMENVGPEIVELSKSIDKTVKNKTEDLFINKKDEVYKYTQDISAIGAFIKQMDYSKSYLSGSKSSTGKNTVTMKNGITYAEAFYAPGAVIEIFTVGDVLHHLVCESVNGDKVYSIYRNGIKTDTTITATGGIVKFIYSEYMTIVAFDTQICVIDLDGGITLFTKIFIDINGTPSSDGYILDVDVINIEYLIVRLNLNGVVYTCHTSLKNKQGSDGLICKVALTDGSVTTSLCVTIGDNVYIGLKDSTDTIYHKIPVSMFTKKISLSASTITTLLDETVEVLLNSKVHPSLPGKRYGLTDAKNKVIVIGATDTVITDITNTLYGFDDFGKMILNDGDDNDIYRCCTANNVNYYLFGSIRESGMYTNNIFTDVSTILNITSRDESLLGSSLIGGADLINDAADGGISINSKDIAMSVFDIDKISNSIKTDAANNTIATDAMGRIIKLEYISINASWQTGSSLDAHYNMFKKIYEKLVSMEAKVIERDTKHTYVTQFTLGK